MKEFCCNSGAHVLSTTHVKGADGKLCFSEAAAGSACSMSPIAPRRTTSIPELMEGPPFALETVPLEDMFDQLFRAVTMRYFLPSQLIGLHR